MEVRSMKKDEVMSSLRSKSPMCSKRRCGSKLDVESKLEFGKNCKYSKYL